MAESGARFYWCLKHWSGASMWSQWSNTITSAANTGADSCLSKVNRRSGVMFLRITRETPRRGVINVERIAAKSECEVDDQTQSLRQQIPLPDSFKSFIKRGWFKFSFFLLRMIAECYSSPSAKGVSEQWRNDEESRILRKPPFRFQIAADGLNSLNSGENWRVCY